MLPLDSQCGDDALQEGDRQDSVRLVEPESDSSTLQCIRIVLLPMTKSSRILLRAKAWPVFRLLFLRTVKCFLHFSCAYNHRHYEPFSIPSFKPSVNPLRDPQ